WELLQERLLIRIVLGSCSVSGSQKHRYADGCDVRNKVNEGEVGARIDLLGAAFSYQLLGQSMIEQGVAHLLESFLDAFGVTVGRHIREQRIHRFAASGQQGGRVDLRFCQTLL